MCLCIADASFSSFSSCFSSHHGTFVAGAVFFYSVVLSNSDPSLLMFEGGSAVAAVE